MNILIIDQCSGSKSYPQQASVLDLAEVDAYRQSDFDGHEPTEIPAKELYDGRQQRYIDEAVEVLRKSGHEIERYFISAGFGLVNEQECLPPYEVTFSNMADSEIEKRAEALEISNDVENVVSNTSHDIIFFAIGSDYAKSVRLSQIVDVIPESVRVVLFNNEDLAESYRHVVSISARTSDAKKHGTIVVALKGIYLKNFARHLTKGEHSTDPSEVVRYCTTTENEETTQSGFDKFG
jgi:hypothetical protein